MKKYVYVVSTLEPDSRFIGAYSDETVAKKMKRHIESIVGEGVSIEKVQVDPDIKTIK